jgi:hypothetical protein
MRARRVLRFWTKTRCKVSGERSPDRMEPSERGARRAVAGEGGICRLRRLYRRAAGESRTVSGSEGQEELEEARGRAP